MKGPSSEDIEKLILFYKALGNETRISILHQLDQDQPVSPIAEEYDISRSGLQKHIEQLIDVDLVYRPAQSEKTYDLTLLGKLSLEKMENDQVMIETVLSKFNDEFEELEAEQEDVLEQMKDAGISTKELDNKLISEAWEELDRDDLEVN